MPTVPHALAPSISISDWAGAQIGDSALTAMPRAALMSVPRLASYGVSSSRRALADPSGAAAELLEDCLIGDLVIRREQDCLGEDDAEHLVTVERQHHLR
jgi:hypothetical protein